MDDHKKYLLRVEKMSKSFGSVHALKEFHIEIKPGEIRGLVGENGSGKSTFSSIVAGMQKYDSGTMYLDDEPYKPNGTVDAVNHGVSMVVQEQGTISKISVAANIFFGKEKQFARNGILNVKEMNKEAEKALQSIHVNNIKPEMMIDQLSFEDRKLVELARALYTSPKIWIIDETTTALSVGGRELLYRLMKEKRDEGKAIIFISHDIEEIMDKCDTLTVLRDGLFIADLEKEEFDADKIRQLLIGRALSGHYYRDDVEVKTNEEIVLELKNVTTDFLKDITIQLHKGEILGVGGLSDCGMHDVGRVFFGLLKPDKGYVLKNQTEYVKSAAWAVKHGIGYVSKNRDQESLMLSCSIADNICLPSLKDITRCGPVSDRKQKQLAEKWAKRMEVKADSVKVFCNTLSGGNKQKVVLAKWLGKGSDIMILDCPTRGIDVGTKAAIYQLIMQMKENGKSIILISEELQELIGMSDRIILLKDGSVSGEFLRNEGLTEAKLIQKMI